MADPFAEGESDPTVLDQVANQSPLIPAPPPDESEDADAKLAWTASHVTPPEELREAFDLLIRALHGLRDNARSTKAAGVKSVMQRLSHGGFTESSFGFETFRAFLDAAREAGVIATEPWSGGDTLVLLPNTSVRGHASITSSHLKSSRRRIRSDLWRAFVDWKPGLARYFDRLSQEIVTFPAQAAPLEPHSMSADRIRVGAAPEQFVAIAPIQQDQQLEWMKEFTSTLEENSAVRDALLDALESDRPLAAFAREARNSPALREGWYGYLSDRVRAVIESWLQANDIILDLDETRPRPDRQDERRIRATATRSASSSLETDTGHPGSADGLRADILSVIAQLPTEELLRIRVPILYALKR